MERMLVTSPIQHPDVFFAQKASSCVKAAGMDPRQMDLRRFYELAAVISTRAYLGIYKESPVGLISDPQNDDDLISNAHKIINGLITKTNDRNLMEISGRDIMLGSRRAVGILINVLYSEGNRLWLLKLNAAEQRSRQTASDNYDKESKGHVLSLLPNRHKKCEFSGMGTRDQMNGVNGIENDAIAVFDGRQHNIIDVDDGISRSDTFGSSEIKTDSDRFSYRLGDDISPQIGVIRKKRASSAPSRSKSGPRWRIAQAQAAAVDRLFSAGKNKDRSNPRFADQLGPQQRNSKGSDKGDGLPYTYDMKSGRKVVLNKAYLDSVARQRNLEAMGNVKKLTDICGGKSEDVLPPVPIRPEWPGKSTSASVDKWMKRMTSTNTDENSSVLRPQTYGAYQLMECLDLVISVEHCFNCAHHSVALRHDTKEYVRNANESLRIVAQLAYECGVCSRVGVTRMRARITSKCKHTDADSRIGACEVQIAYKDVNGVVQTEILHSKIQSRRWPSKVIMEKKFRSFIMQNKVAVHPPRLNPHGVQTGVAQSYLIDFIKWEEITLADPDWTFSQGRDPLAVDLNCNFDKALSQDQRTLNIEWVYDARLFSHKIEAAVPTHQSSPPFPGASEVLKPCRPQTASTLRPCPLNRASMALAKLNAKSPLTSPRTHMPVADSMSPRSDPHLVNRKPSHVRSYADVMQQLKGIVSQRSDLEHTIPYDIDVLVKRGIIVAETVSSCALLRQSMITASFDSSTNGSAVTPDSVRANFVSLFESLDNRGQGFLNITDIDAILTVIQRRRSSDQALRLVILSLDTNGSGKIYFQQFFDFICHHDHTIDTSLLTKHRPVSQDVEEASADELGVIWIQIMMHLHEHSAAKDQEGGMQNMVDGLYACAVSKEDPQEEGVCTKKSFVSFFEKFGLTSILSEDNFALLIRVFGVGESRSMISILTFTSWLLAEGVDMTLRKGTSLVNPTQSPSARRVQTSPRVESHHVPSPSSREGNSRNCVQDLYPSKAEIVQVSGAVKDTKDNDDEEFSDTSIVDLSKQIHSNPSVGGNASSSIPSSSSALPKRLHGMDADVVSTDTLHESIVMENSRHHIPENVLDASTDKDHFLNETVKGTTSGVPGSAIAPAPNKQFVSEILRSEKELRGESGESGGQQVHILTDNFSTANENLKKEERLSESYSSKQEQEEVVTADKGAAESDMVLMVTSVGTTQADEDEEDYEVDFEDYELEE